MEKIRQEQAGDVPLPAGRQEKEHPRVGAELVLELSIVSPELELLITYDRNVPKSRDKPVDLNGISGEEFLGTS